MIDIDQINAIADDCLRINMRIEAHGTDIMKVLIRGLLFEIGKELAREDISRKLRYIIDEIH